MSDSLKIPVDLKRSDVLVLLGLLHIQRSAIFLNFY